MTDEQGRFFFADLPAGRHVIQTLHISYHDTRFAVEITAGDTTRVDLHIGHQELHLEGVHIEGQRVASPAPLVEPDVVFSGNKLRQNLSQTIAETIDYEPGIAQRTMGPAPARPVLRGLSGDRLLILEDGERTGDLSATSSDHAVAVDPMTTQRIEIVRGPETMLYGSNALGGVINVQRGYVPVERPESSGGTISWQGESVNGGLSLGLERVHPLGGSLALRADGELAHGGRRFNAAWHADEYGHPNRQRRAGPKHRARRWLCRWSNRRLPIGLRHSPGPQRRPPRRRYH